MIFEGEFFYNGQLRWNLGWATPNYAGAFLITLAAFLWAWRRDSRWWWVGMVVETGLYFLLAKTYSRGALAALGCSAAFFIIVSGLGRLQQTRRTWSARLALCGSCIWYTGFASRFSPSYLESDGAAMNRWDLWRGGLNMIAAAPLQGWGAGESGREYMNQFQDIDRTENYTTLVNSFLHIAVEHGLPILAIALFILIWLLAIACGAGRDFYNNRQTTPEVEFDSITVAAGGSLAGWAVANGFTTLWIEPKLWVVPGVSIAILLWRIRLLDRRQISSSVSLAAALAIVAIGALWGAGRWQQRSESIRFKPGAERTIVAERAVNATSPHPHWHLWLDAAILGQSPGKELRRWLNESTAPQRVTIHSPDPSRDLKTREEFDQVMLFGRECARLTTEPGVTLVTGRLRLVHPSVPPPPGEFLTNTRPASTILILPEIDETGLNSAWRAWAEHNHVAVVISPKVGLDIRAAWPQMMQSVEQG